MNTVKILCSVLLTSQLVAAEIKPVKHLIDTHIHLYDTTRVCKVGMNRMVYLAATSYSFLHSHSVSNLAAAC